MAGEIINPKRPRYQSNERFDSIDADAASRAPRDHDDALTRSLISTPRATATTAVGLIINGFSLTPNPTAGNDGLIRINTEAGVALDSNGRTIIKPAGTTVDVAIAAGNQQLYIYFLETAGDLAKRRFLPAGSPFTEFTQAINTTLQGGLGTYVRAGTLATTVASDTVNGATVALCLIAIASNAAGVITITGYNATTAPNGSDITNRLTAVTAPTTAPTVNTRNGSIQTEQDLITAALYTAGQTAWKGSDFLTPAAGNNFGAFSIPAGGADKAYRNALGYVTVGNGATVFGDVNTSDYANAKLLLDAAITALPAQGGTILLKRGVALSGFAASTVTLPAGKTVEIVGDHQSTPSTVPQLTFVASESLTCNATGRLILRNLHIRWTGNAVILTTSPVYIQNCFFEKQAAADTGAALSGTNVSDLHLDDVEFNINVNALSTNGMGLRVSGTANRVYLNATRWALTGSACGGVQITDTRDNVVFTDTRLDTFTDVANVSRGLINLASTDNVTQIANRVVDGFHSSLGCYAVQLSTCGNIEIKNLNVAAGLGLYTTAYSGSGPIIVRNSRTLANLVAGAHPDIRFYGVTSTSQTLIGDTTLAQGTVLVEGCQFIGGTTALYIQGSTITQATVRACEFSGQGSTATAAFTPCYVKALTRVDKVLLEGNIISNFQNVAFAGADAFHRIFRVSALVAGQIVCRNNTGQHIMDTSTGAARHGCYLLETNSGDEATANAVFSILLVEGNVWGSYQGSGGASGDYVMLLRSLNYATVEEICIKDNFMETEYTVSAGVTALNHLIDLTTTANSTLKKIHFEANHLRVRAGTSLAAMVIDVFRSVKGGGTGSCYSATFQNNQIQFESSAPAFDGANGYGINIPSQTIFNLTMKGNTVSYFAAAITNFLKVRITGAVTNTLPSGGQPGSGSAWTENINIATV